MKTKTISATYVWSVSTQVVVPADATHEEQRLALDESIKNAAPDGKPILHDCSNPNLIDWDGSHWYHSISMMQFWNLIFATDTHMIVFIMMLVIILAAISYVVKNFLRYLTFIITKNPKVLEDDDE